MTEINPVVSAPLRTQKADEKFLFFLRTAPNPITEDSIALFYAQYVMLPSSFCTRHLNDKTFAEQDLVSDVEALIRYNSIQWFDRSLGRAMRKRLLSESPKLNFTSPAPLRLRNAETLSIVRDMERFEKEECKNHF